MESRVESAAVVGVLELGDRIADIAAGRSSESELKDSDCEGESI